MARIAAAVGVLGGAVLLLLSLPAVAFGHLWGTRALGVELMPSLAGPLALVTAGLAMLLPVRVRRFPLLLTGAALVAAANASWHLGGDGSGRVEGAVLLVVGGGLLLVGLATVAVSPAGRAGFAPALLAAAFVVVPAVEFTRRFLRYAAVVLESASAAPSLVPTLVAVALVVVGSVAGLVSGAGDERPEVGRPRLAALSALAPVGAAAVGLGFLVVVFGWLAGFGDVATAVTAIAAAVAVGLVVVGGVAAALAAPVGGRDAVRGAMVAVAVAPIGWAAMIHTVPALPDVPAAAVATRVVAAVAALAGAVAGGWLVRRSARPGVVASQALAVAVVGLVWCTASAPAPLRNFLHDTVVAEFAGGGGGLLLMAVGCAAALAAVLTRTGSAGAVWCLGTLSAAGLVLAALSVVYFDDPETAPFFADETERSLLGYAVGAVPVLVLALLVLVRPLRVAGGDEPFPAVPRNRGRADRWDSDVRVVVLDEAAHAMADQQPAPHVQVGALPGERVVPAEDEHQAGRGAG